MTDAPRRGLSTAAHRRVVLALESLTGDQANQVAVRLAGLGPLAGALGSGGQEPVPHTRDEVEALVITMFDQHALDAPEPDREDLDLILLQKAVASVLRDT